MMRRCRYTAVSRVAPFFLIAIALGLASSGVSADAASLQLDGQQNANKLDLDAQQHFTVEKEDLTPTEKTEAAQQLQPQNLHQQQLHQTQQNAQSINRLNSRTQPTPGTRSQQTLQNQRFNQQQQQQQLQFRIQQQTGINKR